MLFNLLWQRWLLIPALVWLVSSPGFAAKKNQNDDDDTPSRKSKKVSGKDSKASSGKKKKSLAKESKPDPKPEPEPVKPIHETVVSSLEPDELTGFDKLPQKLQTLMSAGLALTKRNLGYQFGSSDPGHGGMDCSGTMYYVLTENGFKDTPRQSDEQYLWLNKAGQIHDASAAKSLDDPIFKDLHPGDLLFWSGTYEAGNRAAAITHVMLYLGLTKDKRPVMFGASDGRPYQGKRHNGVSVFDFVLPKDENKAHFAGFGSLPGINSNDIAAAPPNGNADSSADASLQEIQILRKKSGESKSRK